MVGPGFKIACLEEGAQQAEEPVVVDMLRQDGFQNRVIQTIEARGDIALDKPSRPCPCMSDIVECGMASPSWSEPVCVWSKARLEVGIEDETDDFLQQLIRPGRKAEGSELGGAFRWDVDRPYRCRATAF